MNTTSKKQRGLPRPDLRRLARTLRGSLRAVPALSAILAMGAGSLYSADHSDAPILINSNRLDANLQDLYAWTRGSGGDQTLVLIITWTSDQGLAPDQFTNASDKTFTIHIDTNSAVDTSNSPDIVVPPGIRLGKAGGTIANPGGIGSELRIKITFDALGAPQLDYQGFAGNAAPAGTKTFFGLREDPFLNILVSDLDVGAAVFELPAASVFGGGGNPDPILIWATSDVAGLGGSQEDIVGRGMYTNFSGPSFDHLVTDQLDRLPPNQHTSQTGLLPDVLIFDPSKETNWPNGRRLRDKDITVAALTSLGAPLTLLAPPSDRNFLDVFPFLGPPHRAVNELLVGNWVGWAEPDGRFQAPFDQVRFQVTFFNDGTAYWNDGHELRFGHGTGHGAWEKVGLTGFTSTFYWIQYDSAGASPDGVKNVFKLRFSGNLDPDSPDTFADATLNLTIFPNGTDALDPTDAGGNAVFGTFNVENCRRVFQSVPGLEDISGDSSGELIEGAWWGKAVPAPDNLNPPFPEVVMMLTFASDHNIIATDVFELAAPHVTAHGGPWIRTSANRVHGTFVWTNMTAETDYNGYAKVRIFGDIDPEGVGDLDYITGAVRPSGFATGADVLALPDSPFSGFLGQFNIAELTRIKVDPNEPTTAGKDYRDNLPNGAWIGTATATDPSAKYDELVITPHFLPNGTIIWNDSMEHNDHGTGFGDWRPTGPDGNGIKMVGVLQKMDPGIPNSFAGMIKIKYTGQVDPNNPDEMTGTFELIDFPAAAIPLPSPDRSKVFHADPNDTGGTSIGIYSYTIKRITHQPLPGPVQTPPPPQSIEGNDYLNQNELVGNWVGWAEPENLFQAPFDQVRFQVTLFEDGTAYWNDGHELRFGHGTGHGAWERVGATKFKSTFYWIQYDGRNLGPNGVGSIFKLQFTGDINAPNPNGSGSIDEISNGKLRLTIFPPGTDPLDPNDAGGQPVFGIFEVEDCRRVKQSLPDLTDVSGDPSGEFVEGAWWGKAVPAPDNLFPPFPEVVMMLTFTRDHNIIATDVFELAAPHVTAHGGPWIRLEDNAVHGTFVWTNMTPESDYNGYAKVRIVGNIDPGGVGDLDHMTGTVRPSGFATGADVLDPTDGFFSGFLGQFNIAELTRVKVNPDRPTVPGADYSQNSASGVWMGNAVSENPANSPFAEIFVLPHFLPDGNVIWNDSREHSYPHGTGFGNWEPTGPDGNGIKMIGVIQKFDTNVPNNFGGMIKVKFNAEVDPDDPGTMSGSFELVDFPAGAITLPSPNRAMVFHRDPNDTGGTSLGTFRFNNLRRVTPSAGVGHVSASTETVFNPQTGLIEQTITVTNNTANRVQGFRLDISDLPEGVRVHNANNTGNSIFWDGALGVGESVDLLVEYYSTTTRDPFTPTLVVITGTAANPPDFDAGLVIERIFLDADGAVVVEFPSIPGRDYFMQYSEDGVDWHTVLPMIEANSTRTQWKDSGPPKTATHPRESDSRLYRVAEE